MDLDSAGFTIKEFWSVMKVDIIAADLAYVGLSLPRWSVADRDSELG